MIKRNLCFFITFILVTCAEIALGGSRSEFDAFCHRIVGRDLITSDSIPGLRTGCKLADTIHIPVPIDDSVDWVLDITYAFSVQGICHLLIGIACDGQAPVCFTPNGSNLRVCGKRAFQIVNANPDPNKNIKLHKDAKLMIQSLALNVSPSFKDGVEHQIKLARDIVGVCENMARALGLLSELQVDHAANDLQAFFAQLTSLREQMRLLSVALGSEDEPLCQLAIRFVDGVLVNRNNQISNISLPVVSGQLQLVLQQMAMIAGKLITTAIRKATISGDAELISQTKELDDRIKSIYQ